jgi:hypothetical protein
MFFLNLTLGVLSLMAVAAWADTPTPTVTPATPIRVVSLDHNRFNPLAGESVRMVGLRADHGAVSVMVYNPSGTLVRRVADHADAAVIVPEWDGRNEQGEMVASGVYLVVATGNKLHKRFRIAVLK